MLPPIAGIFCRVIKVEVKVSPNPGDGVVNAKVPVARNTENTFTRLWQKPMSSFRW